MATNVRDTMKSLSPARRKKIEARAATLIAEEMSLRDLRQALTLTQERMAETLGIGQDGISRLEKRSDLLLSTLRTYIEAMGGQLSLIAEFPDREPVTLTGLAAMEATAHPPTRRRRKRTRDHAA
jgi:transcriptional regulator with XRE-family HTH domain